jgi:hypothetical protein
MFSSLQYRLIFLGSPGGDEGAEIEEMTSVWSCPGLAGAREEERRTTEGTTEYFERMKMSVSNCRCALISRLRSMLSSSKI